MFKTKKYQVIKNAISYELANFIFNYFLLKRDAVNYMYQNNIHSQSSILGTWTDEQIPNTYACYADFVMETLMMKVLPKMQQETGLQLVPTYSYARTYKKGDELKTILISADTDRERISLGVKQLTVNKFQEYAQENQKGKIVKGKILEKTPKFISIELGDSVVGNLKLSELASDKSIDSMNINDELDLIITNVDKKNQSISLSMKVLEKQNEDQALNEYNKTNESVGASLGDILKEQIDK